MKNNKSFAEVVESSLHTFTCQCWQWDNVPSFGSLVTITTAQRTLFGLVYEIQTGSMDPVRYPFPYQKTEAELKKEQPQIFEFLKTTFNCITLGYQEKGKIFYTTAPEPPKIHSFIEAAPQENAKQFFYSHNYLHILFNASSYIQNIDELLLALLKNQQRDALVSQERLTKFMHTYALLTGNDYRRMKLFLSRVQNIV